MHRTKGMLLTILSAMTFGFAFTLAPMIYGEGGGNPVMLTFLRNTICLPIFLLILWVKKISFRLNKKELCQILILGTVGMTLTNLLLNLALSLIDVGIATTLHFVYPVFVTLGCAVFFREKLTLKKAAALVLACAGIVCFVFGPKENGTGNLALGIAVALASGATYAFYMIYLDKSGLSHMNPFKLTFYLAATAALWMFFAGSLSGNLNISSLTPKAWILSAVFSILCSVVALCLVQLGIKHVGASAAAILSTFEPVTSVLFGWILLGETLSVTKIAGCILIFAGVLVISIHKRTDNNTTL
jgi:integral membrane protein